MSKIIKLGDIIGTELEEEFASFDLTDIQEVLLKLQETDPVDLAHAELLQQQSLRCADILTEYLGKIVKTVGYLEARVNTVKNKASLEYKAPDGSRTTVEMRKWAGDSSQDVEDLLIKLSRAKASKSVLEKKFDIMIKLHHHFKDITMGLRRTILGYSTATGSKTAEGWE